MIELSRHILAEAKELARTMFAENIIYAPLPSTPSMCVSTDISLIVYLESIEVEGTLYYIGLKRPPDDDRSP